MDVVQKVVNLPARQIGFCILHEHMDTTIFAGKFQFHFFSALAELQRGLIRDRTMAGLSAARARRRVGARPWRLTLE